MSKFKKGDKVILSQFAPIPGILNWIPEMQGLIGKTFTLESWRLTGYWSIDYACKTWGWAESGMSLVGDEHPTVPNMPAVKDIPQWMVSRVATLNQNECASCGAPLPCDLHSAKLSTDYQSIGNTMAKAWARYKP